MDEKLVRGELPIQSIYQRGGAVTATVPIHLAILNLPKEVRNDVSLITGAKDVVKPWYDEDMTYYLDILRQNGLELPWLKGYEKFIDEWQLGGESNNEFLSLSWRENGEVHNIKYNPIPVVLHNQHDEFEEFYTPESWRRGRCIEIIYRNVTDPEFVAMSPDKMQRYQIKNDIARIHKDRGLAEVMSNAFSSDYHMNMAKTLLLRNYAVFYLNRLLDKTKISH